MAYKDLQKNDYYSITRESYGSIRRLYSVNATKNGIKSLIFIPEGAPISKVEATKNFGAEVCLVEGTYDYAYEKLPLCSIQSQNIKSKPLL